MGVYVWRPEKKGAEDLIRKLYTREGKVAQSWPRTWTLERGYSNEDATLQNIYREICEIREQDESVCLGYARPRAQAGLGAWRRTKEILADEDMQIVCLDFDGEDSRIFSCTSVSKRLEVIKDLLPILQGVGLVAFYSSSALFEDEEKPNRINLHVMVRLDQPYPRDKIAALLDSFEIVDTALGVITQPHIVANPIFQDRKPLDLPSPGIVIEKMRHLLENWSYDVYPLDGNFFAVHRADQMASKCSLADGYLNIST